MKILYKVLGFLFIPLALTLFSCESLVEETKYDFIQDGDVPDSEEGADMWVTGTYSKLSDNMFRNNTFPQVLEFDNDYVSGPDWSFGAIGAGNFQGDNQTQAMWESLYSLIHRANYSLENIEAMTNLSDEHRAHVTAELYFLKGYAYFLLVRAFGEVPIRRHSVNSGLETLDQPRQSIPDVYAHIIELLSFAQDNMYTNTHPRFVEGHASAGAAASFLAKVYVTIASASMPTGATVDVKGGIPADYSSGTKALQDYTTNTYVKNQVAGYESFDSQEYFRLAMEKADQVIRGDYGDYDLLPFATLWSQSNKNKVEHIWSFQALSGDVRYGPQYGQGFNGVYTDGVLIQGLWWGMRDHWYRLFEESRDLRVRDGVRHRYVISWQDNPGGWFAGSVYPSYGEYWDASQAGVPPYDDGRQYVNDLSNFYLAFLTKYSDVTDNSIERQDSNYPLMRFADVLLIYAEAANEVNGAPTNEALDALNAIRTRSNATPKTLDGAGGIGSLEAFRSAVIEERAMELALEGDRRWDLIRWGIYLDVMNSIGGYDEANVNKTRSSRNLLYPIPETELNSNKAITTNNPGW